MINLNLAWNGYLVPPTGFPFRLTPQIDNTMTGVLPNWATQVDAVLSADAGTVDAHAAIYSSPTTTQPLGSDGALVEQVDLTGIGASEQTLTLAIPAPLVPTVYVFRIWIDNQTGNIPETIARDASVTDVTKQPYPPAGVTFSSVIVS